jgi:hypothetical protein
MLAARNAYLAMLIPRYGLLFRRPLLLHPTRWLFASGHGIGARLLARRMTAAIELAAHERVKLPSADCFDVRYEDLCVRPNDTLAGVLGWLGLDNSGVPDVSAMIAPRGGKLLPEVERLRPRIATRLSDYYRRFSYAVGS